MKRPKTLEELISQFVHSHATLDTGAWLREFTPGEKRECAHKQEQKKDIRNLVKRINRFFNKRGK